MSEQKIELFWRDATADDVAEIVKTGKTREARFRDNDISNWVLLSLTGFRRESGYDWLDCNYVGWRFCQVYDPQQWFLNKPDPGEWYRLLGKFPPEPKLATDDYWSDLYKGWRESGSGDGDQNENVWYRRRIANNPEIPDSSRSRDIIPSGWRLLGKDEDRLASDAYWSQSCKEWLLIGDDRVAIANELPKWHAIRLTTNVTDLSLIEGFGYVLPGGGRIRVTAKGFDVLQ